jgi:hypothetical protein
MPVAVMIIHIGTNTWPPGVTAITAVAVAEMAHAAAGCSNEIAARRSGGVLPQIVGLEATSAALNLRGNSCDERI